MAYDVVLGNSKPFGAVVTLKLAMADLKNVFGFELAARTGLDIGIFKVAVRKGCVTVLHC